jgi:hypothetical protein
LDRAGDKDSCSGPKNFGQGRNRVPAEGTAAALDFQGGEGFATQNITCAGRGNPAVFKLPEAISKESRKIRQSFELTVFIPQSDVASASKCSAAFRP